MYDQATSELVGHAPHFGDLNLEQLPKAFTDGYTQIITARLRLNDLHNTEDQEELSNLFNEMKKIASTYEAYVFLQIEKDQVPAAAFVAASAHHLCSQINIALTSDLPEKEPLSNLGIDSRISAAILYFISGYTADASEMIKIVNDSQEDTSASRAFHALKQLLSGQIEPLELNIPIYPTHQEWGDEIADKALWGLIHEGINELLGGLTGQVEESQLAFNDAGEIFDRVLGLSVGENKINYGEVNLTYKPIYVGQYYLSKLLRIVTKTIPDVALICIDSPNEIDAGNWRTQMKRFSAVRPYLWFNHIDAINSGYLNPGVSSVVSFPTGGGKSTLSELKITTSLLKGEAVVFIVPTLALVDQVAKSLKEAFPSVTTKMSFEEFGLDNIDVEVLPEISVMTPESCLVRMSFNPELYGDVGLFVFDECHLLHSKTKDVTDKRSLDSMLCLLRMLDLSQNVDLLLMSAMLSNNDEVAAWLSSLINRQVLSLSMTWKPTRQAKGCVVYNSQRIQEINEYTRVEAPRTPAGNLTAAAKRMLTAEPYCFFSLNQTWHSDRRSDYKLTKLSGDLVTLSFNSEFNYLTANRNKVAAKIASDYIGVGIKTLVFAGTKKECDSIVTSSSIERINGEIVWTEEEQQLINAINAEFGSEQHSYANVNSSSLPHHGLLIREERLLHESLFRRVDGVNLIVATSTLAQGMNLPAECVIIAGNTRFDIEAGQPEELDAHELLNAAGRAGRAGQNSAGIVLVIPSRVVNFNAAESRITQYWNEIKEVFSQSDQCLIVEDPLAQILDKIHDNPDVIDDDVRHFLLALPIVDTGDSTEFLNKTFQAYKARQNNNEDWINARILVANQAFQRVRDIDDDLVNTWHDQLSSISGIPISLIRQLHAALIENIDNLHNVHDVMAWYMGWLSGSVERLSNFLRMQTLDYELGTNYRDLNGQEKCQYFSNELLNLVGMWISGSTLREVELEMGTQENRLKICEKARKFSIRIVPEIAYAANILSQVYGFHIADNENGEIEKLHIKLLGRLVRVGVNSPEKLALNIVLGNNEGRVSTHEFYNELVFYIDEIENLNDFDSILREVGRAYRLWQLIG